MNCPVCGAEGADDQPVGPSVTVFCCTDCLSRVLNSFAGHVEKPTRRRVVTQGAATATPAWSPSPA